MAIWPSQWPMTGQGRSKKKKEYMKITNSSPKKIGKFEFLKNSFVRTKISLNKDLSPSAEDTRWPLWTRA